VKTFIRTITIEIEAETPEHADGVVVAACEHLADTFNDDGSIECWPQTKYERDNQAQP